MASIDNFNREELLNLGKKVKLRRQKMDLSQEEFSDKAGLHRTYISQFERGLRNPTYTTLVKIATTLGISLKELLETKT